LSFRRHHRAKERNRPFHHNVEAVTVDLSSVR
jgi:hypothetical protein